MSKRLLVLRHAKSSWADEQSNDHDRPLNDRGRRDAPRVGKRMRDTQRIPDLIVSSTAKRARKTAQKVAKKVGYDGEVVLRQELYMADPGTYVRVVAETNDDVNTLLVVGHNPGIESFVRALTGEDTTMPTAALVEIDLPYEKWGELAANPTGRLVEIWRPKDE